MKNTLLVQSESGNWCIYYRHAELIPYSILYEARCIYNNDTKEWIKNTQGSKLPEDISSLPVADHLLSPLGKFVAGIIFGDDDCVGNSRIYQMSKSKANEEWERLKLKL